MKWLIAGAALVLLLAWVYRGSMRFIERLNDRLGAGAPPVDKRKRGGR